MIPTGAGWTSTGAPNPGDPGYPASTSDSPLPKSTARASGRFASAAQKVETVTAKTRVSEVTGSIPAFAASALAHKRNRPPSLRTVGANEADAAWAPSVAFTIAAFHSLATADSTPWVRTICGNNACRVRRASRHANIRSGRGRCESSARESSLTEEPDAVPCPPSFFAIAHRSLPRRS